MEKDALLKVISDIRDKIYNSFANIEFYEDTHEYFVTEGNGDRKKYTPVSYVIHQWNQPFDEDKIAERYAIKNNLIKEDVLRDWKYNNLCSTISGTRTHLYGEGYTWLKCGLNEKIPSELAPQYVEKFNWLIPTAPKENAIKKFYDELHPTLTPIGAEFKMSSQFMNDKIHTRMCGTADLLCYYDNPTDETKSGVILMDYKGLDINLPILTKEGWKKIVDIKNGDIVYDKEGKETTVLNTSEIHHNVCYTVKLDNNYIFTADHEHRWLVNVNGEEKVLTTREIHERMKKGEAIKIEVSQPIQQTIKNNINVWDLYSLGEEIAEGKKELPYECLFYDEEKKKFLLMGIMDKCGSFDHINGSYFVSVERENTSLYKSLVSLVSSFGLYIKIKEMGSFDIIEFKSNKYFFFKRSFYYDFDEIETKKYYDIVKVEVTNTIPTKCLEVDSETHTFLFGYNMIVTHNTNKDLYNDYKRKNNICMLPPFDFLIDEPLSHYSLQFGCYQLMLESIGIPVIGRRLIWLKDNEYELIKVDDRRELLLSVL